MPAPIVLVNPPLTTLNRYVHSDYQEPMGLLFLAGYLRAQGLPVEVVDFFGGEVRQVGDYFWQGADEPEIEAEIRRRSPIVLGITAMFSIHCEGVHRVAAAAKRVDPSLLVVVGGAHASAFAQFTASDRHIDVVVVGEGERTLEELARHRVEGTSWENVSGIVYRDASGAVRTTAARKCMGLTSHPGPARDLLPLERYIATEYSRWHAMHSRRLPVMTSRGCPYRCIFCSIQAVWRHGYYKRNPQSVLDEIEMLITNHGIGEIMFWDDNLALDRKHFEALLDGMIERCLPIRWCTPNGIAIWLLDEKLIDKARRSGCYKLTFGIETGCPKTQRFIRKDHIDLLRTKELIAHCNAVGLWTMSPFIIGFPGETRDDVLLTIDYAIDCGVDVASFFVATPYPGSDLYDIYKEMGLLPAGVESMQPDRWIGNVAASTLRTDALSAPELNALTALANRRFRAHRLRRFMNPTYLASKVHRLDDLLFILKFIPQGVDQFLLPRLGLSARPASRLAHLVSRATGRRPLAVAAASDRNRSKRSP
jgi:anaerobic magnesium-protoporphyrin IX monomethyl ester cyclase